MQKETTKTITELMDNHTRRIEERIEELKNAHKAEIDSIKSELRDMDETMKHRVQKIDTRVNSIEESYTRRIEQLEGEVHTLACENIQLKKQTESQDDQIDSLLTNLEENSMCLEDQMQYSRRNCLIVTGLAEHAEEDTDNVIKSFAKDNLDIQLEDSDIDRSHRLGRKQVGKPRPIIVKFVRYNVRRQVLKSRKKLKGKKMGIQEHLTPFTEHLLKKAEDLSRKAAWVKRVWTWDGRVVCLVQYSETHPERKITVRTYEDLNKIWLKGEKPSPKSPMGKKKITDPDYEKAAWEKNEKRD